VNLSRSLHPKMCVERVKPRHMLVAKSLETNHNCNEFTVKLPMIPCHGETW